VGVLERMVKHKDLDPDRDDYGHFTGLRRRYSRVVERPGISPALVTKLLDSTVFLTLDDLGFELPDYTEYPVVLPMIGGNGDGPDQAEVYDDIHFRLRRAAINDWSLMAEYLQTTLSWPNACWREEETSLGVIAPLPADRLYPKEEWLVAQCREEQRRGRRVLVFCRQTASRDIQPRLARLLRRAGLRTVILRSSVGARRRERWVRNRIRDGLDVLICNPRLVQTGLDLVDFSTNVFYEIDYSIYTMMQASRRTWRLGQTRPVHIYFPIYAGTMEHRATAHVGSKIAAAQLLYGGDVAGALVGQAGAGGNFLEDLAREVAENSQVPDLDDLFVQKSRAAEAACAGERGQGHATGWLTGSDSLPVIMGRPVHGPVFEPVSLIDPSDATQLTMF
jgi:hypothetical protein